jgi:hypothetical protein
MEYEMLLDNDKVRVSRVKIMAGEEVGLHRDEYPAVVIALQGGTITRLEADGTTTDVVFPSNVPVFRPIDPPDLLHRSVNSSSNAIELIVTQLKF